MTDADAQSFRSRTKILSTVKCPEPATANVRTIFRRNGAVEACTFALKYGGSFDAFQTAIVEGETSARNDSLRLDSPRDWARWAYYRGNELYAKIGPPLRVDAPVFDVRRHGPNNISHFLIDMIPLSLYARSQAGPETILLFPKFGRTWEARSHELLAIFGIKPTITRRTVAGPIVIVSGMRAFAPYPVHLVPDYSPTAMFPHIYESFAFAKTVAFDKVYIGRRDARSLTNAAEVEALMKSFGYTPVYMEDYSIADQASIGAHAKHVVAIHGAAMAYLALSRRVETVIEIFPPHVFQSHFALALGARVGRYFVVVPDFDERVMLTGWQTFKNRPFAADLDLLRQALGEAGHRETG